jgi:hypothetical protein
MTHWEQIQCQRGHDTHRWTRVSVSLGGPTGYADLTPIPVRLGRRFEIDVWDPTAYPVDGGAYCCAHDSVSETIAALGVWAPDETTLALTVLDGRAGGRFYDFGAQAGWFTLLAASCGAAVTAFEADAENVRLLQQNATINGWRHLIDVEHVRVDERTEPLAPESVRLAKIDVEGAENHVIRVLWPSIAAGLVDHLLIEITPLFADYYPQLVADLVGAGYRAWVLPPKQHPPVDLADPETALAPYRLDDMPADKLAAMVAGWGQEMAFFSRTGTSW